MRKHITKTTVERSKPAAKPYQIHDTLIPGFVLRVQPTGKKIWKLIVNRKPTTIGQYPAMSVAMATERAKQILNGEIEAQSRVPTLDSFINSHYKAFVEIHHCRPSETLSILERFGFGRVHLDKIRLADVERWRNNKLQEGTAPRTVNNCCTVLKACLQRALDWEVIPEHPLSRLKPLKHDKTRMVRYLDDNEYSRMIHALDDSTPWLKTLVVVALNTGLRRGELGNLVWSDIDLKRSSLVVHGKGAKSGQTRHIPLNDTAKSALKAFRGDVLPMGNIHVFGACNFRKPWAEVLEKSGIESFRFHDCRHTFASRLVSAGVPLNTVRELMGHSKLDMTLIYAHLAPDNMKSAVEMIG